jgi:hypothetical protein
MRDERIVFMKKPGRQYREYDERDKPDDIDEHEPAPV